MSAILVHRVIDKCKNQDEVLEKFWTAVKKTTRKGDPQQYITIDRVENEGPAGYVVHYVPEPEIEADVKEGLNPAKPEPIPAFRNCLAFESIDKEQPVPVDDVQITKFNPRKHFDDDKIKALAADIDANGLINGITVRPKGKYKYELVAGERRLRAFKLLGRKTIPAKVRDLTDEQVLNIMLSENLHREDLNPIEEANHLKRVLEIGKITQTDLAKRIGKSQEWVSERLRLASAPSKVQDLIIGRSISINAAIDLLGWQQSVLFDEMLDAITKEGECTVKRVQEIIKQISEPELVSIPNYDNPVPEPEASVPIPVEETEDDDPFGPDPDPEDFADSTVEPEIEGPCLDCVIGGCPVPEISKEEAEASVLTDAERKLLEADPEPVVVGERHRAAAAYAKQVAEHEKVHYWKCNTGGDRCGKLQCKLLVDDVGGMLHHLVLYEDTDLELEEEHKANLKRVCRTIADGGDVMGLLRKLFSKEAI